MPAPGEPPELATMRHPKYGAAVARWVYRDAAGSALFAVARFNHTDAEGKPAKEFMPYTYGHRVWTTKAGNRLDKIQWHAKAPPEPRALYGLDRLASQPDALVVLVEGEKKVHAAEARFTDVVGVAAMNGAKAPAKSDWSALAGRHVVVWPDADEPGIGFGKLVADLAQVAGAASVRIVAVPVGVWPIKWDLANTDMPDGVTDATLREMLDAAPPAMSVADEPAAEAEQDQSGISAEAIAAEISRLAGLPEIEYAKVRKDAAKALFVGLRELDAEVKTERQRQRKASMSSEEVTAEIDRLSRLPKEEYIRERKVAAQSLLMGVLDLDAAIGAEKAKRRAAAEAENRARPAPAAGETQWPLGIFVGEDGLYADTGGEGGPIWVCAPITVLGEGRDAAGEGWSLYLKWRDRDGQPHTWPMPKKMLMVQPGELEAALVDRGLNLDVEAGSRAMLRHALNGVKSGSRVTLVSQPGWHAPGNGETAFCLLNGETIGEAAETLVLKVQSENANQKMAIAGTLAEWKAGIAAKALGNPVAAFSICAAFTGPLLDPMSESSGGFHFYGRSKTGKTLAMRMALSVWGAPKKSGLLRDWRSTANGLEGAAEECNDGLLPLDEIHQADAKEVVGAIYQLANESGKGRLHRDTSNRQRKTWRIIVLSTGEVDIAAMAGRAGGKLPAGAEVRLPSIHLDGRDMWPELHGATSPVDLMAELQTAMPRQYGTAIRAFLSQLTAERNTVDSDLEAMVAALRDRFYEQLPKGHDPQVRDVARRCALVAAAGEMAIAWDILPWKEGDAARAAETILDWWLSRRGGAGSSEESQHVKAVRAFLSEFGASRFVALDWEQEHGKPGHWIERHPDRPIQSRAGWKRISGDGDQYLITTDAWHDLCSKAGVDPVETAKTLEAAKFLATPGDNKNLTKPIKVPGMTKTRFYVVEPAIFGSEVPQATAAKPSE